MANKILYLTEVVNGVKLAVPVTSIAGMQERPDRLIDYGIFSNSPLQGSGNLVVTEITGANGNTISVLYPVSEILDAISFLSTSDRTSVDLHMDGDMRHRRVAMIYQIADQSLLQIVKGFGAPEVFSYDPFTVPRPEIELTGPRTHEDLRYNMTNGLPIDGSRPTDSLRTLDRANLLSAKKKLES